MLSDRSDKFPDVLVLSPCLSLGAVASLVTVNRSLLFSCFFSLTSFSCPLRFVPCDAAARFCFKLLFLNRKMYLLTKYEELIFFSNFVD